MTALIAMLPANVARVLLAGLTLIVLAAPASATVITPQPVDFTVGEQTAFDDAVATFDDDNAAATPADFTATIDWGDGSSVTTGTIGQSSGAFVVIGQHTYTDEGSFTVTVTIADVSPGTGTATATDTATVTEADVLSGSPVTFSVPPGVSFTKTVATFTDTLTAAVPGAISQPPSLGRRHHLGGYDHRRQRRVPGHGTHTYAGAGTFTVTVTLSDDAPGTATATVTSTANVAAGLASNGVNFTTPEGTAFNGTVATFSDADTSKTPASFVSTINWGDSTTTAGTITGSTGVFTLSGQHTYADEGTFSVSMTITETGAGGATTNPTATATVTEADALVGAPVAFSPQAAIPFTGTVANFTDSDTANVPGDFTATIDWGDATTTTGTVSGSGGSFVSRAPT